MNTKDKEIDEKVRASYQAALSKDYEKAIALCREGVYLYEIGEFETSVFPVIVQKNDAQSYGSAVSYARRYSLSGILNLTIQDSDDDGNSASDNNEASGQKPPKKEQITWLTEEQYNATLAADIKGIEAVLKKYSGDGFGIKKDWKNALEIKLKMLKDGK